MSAPGAAQGATTGTTVTLSGVDLIDLSTGLYRSSAYCLPCLAMTRELHCFLCGAPTDPQRPKGWPDVMTKPRAPTEIERVPGGIEP